MTIHDVAVSTGPTLHQELCREAEPHRRAYRPDKPGELEEVRRQASRRLTSLLLSKPAFSFIRLGDCELSFLLAAQADMDPGFRNIARSNRVSSNVAYGDPGLDRRHARRLLAAYQNADYVDFHDRYWFNAAHNAKLRLSRAAHLHRNENADTSHLFLEWALYEFTTYVSRRRCLFVGAEAGVLGSLYADPKYRTLAGNLWPGDAEPFFLDESRPVNENLDRIKADVCRQIEGLRIDTAFLSLGGGAKILCCEIAAELGVRCFDSGAIIRGLAYSGQSGEADWRAVHNPFFFRVPFDTYMAAVDRTFPRLLPEQRLSRAHAQLCLELQRKERGWSYAADLLDGDCFDDSAENRRHFRFAMRHYRRRYRPLQVQSDATRRQVVEFDEWCARRGIGLKAKLRRAQTTVRTTLGRAARAVGIRRS
jgi:hypothetical protein